MFQLGSALLDACVLAVLSKGDTYGYLLTQDIRGVIEVSESTLYPVLRRLQAEQALVTYDSPFNGRNRRYYQITPQGSSHLEYLRENWQQFKEAVEYLLLSPPPTVPPPESDFESTSSDNDSTAASASSDNDSIAATSDDSLFTLDLPPVVSEDSASALDLALDTSDDTVSILDPAPVSEGDQS